MNVNGVPVDIPSLSKGRSQEWGRVVGKHIGDSVQAWISAAAVCGIRQDLNLSEAEAKLALLPIAASFAQVPISSFPVGALCEGGSGRLYFGANIEIPHTSLDNTIHAEQASIVNALFHEERSIQSIAVSATPCGYCRQFLNELEEAGTIAILIPGQPEQPFSNLLPFAFGAKELGRDSGNMNRFPNRHLRLCGPNSADLLVKSALSAANRSYAPYTKQYAGIAMRLQSGVVICGSYLESAAYNPSVSPIQAAMVNLILHGYAFRDIQKAVLVQMGNSLCDWEGATRNTLKALGEKIELQVYCIH